MEEIEIWKSLDFLGYPNYEISNFGNVKSLNYRHSKKEKILKPRNNGQGYLQLDLYKDGKKKNFSVHRLVCLAFLKNPENLPCVNHKDENKQNNHVENLEWCSHKQNNNYGTRNERVSKKLKDKPKSEEHKQKLRKPKSEEHKQKLSKANSIPIIQLDLQNNFICEWDSATTASIELNINQSNISGCCNGKRKTSGGFIWRYK